MLRGFVVIGRPERQPFAELIFHCIFRCLLNPLIINPIRSMDLYNQTTILLLIISNRLLRKKIEDCHSTISPQPAKMRGPEADSVGQADQSTLACMNSPPRLGILLLYLLRAVTR